MDIRLLLTGLAVTLVPGLAGCSKDDAGFSASAPGVRAKPTAQPASPVRGAPRNHIELVVDGETYRADIVSNFGHTFLVDSADPRYHLEMTSAWLGSDGISILKLGIVNVDEHSRTVPLDGTGTQVPTLMLMELPGHSGKRWRSTAGSLDLQFESIDPRTQPVTRAIGRFDATVRELHQDSEDFVDGGQELTVSGSFDFSRDRR